MVNVVKLQMVKSTLAAVLRKEYSLKLLESQCLPGFDDRNVLVLCQTESGSASHAGLRYLVKLTSFTKTDIKIKHINFQRRLIQHIYGDGIITGRVLDTTAGSSTCCVENIFSLVNETHSTDSQQTKQYILRVLEYVPGDQLKRCWASPHIDDIVFELGIFVGNIHHSLRKFPVETTDIPKLNDDDLWTMDNFPQILTVLDCIQDMGMRKSVELVLMLFKSYVLPRYDDLPKGVIHGDIHDLNIVVNFHHNKLHPIYARDTTTQSNVSDTPTQLNVSDTTTESNSTGCAKDIDVKQKFGIIDFGDSGRSCYIFEIAKVIMDILTCIPDVGIVKIGEQFLGGYFNSCQTLSETELDVLPVCVMAGLCQYIVLGEYEFQQQPNNEYVKLGAKEAGIQLKKLLIMNHKDILRAWKYLNYK